MEHSSKGDLHYVLGLLELFPKCHPSTRGSTRSLLRTLCTAFTLAFFAGSKDASDWMSNCSLQSHSLAALFCPWRARQSSLTSVWTSLASCKSLSLVNLVRPLDWFWWDVRGIHIQLKLMKPIPVIDAWLDKVVHQEIVFKRRLYSTHLQCKNMIYLLTIF